MIASGKSIRNRQFITPFSERSKAFGMTYGLSPAGYDLRVGQSIVLYPGDFKLGSCLERMVMPNDLLGVVHDKSTWARQGLALQNTVIEPGWEGYLTIELTNHGRYRIVLEKGMPICQVVFHILDEPTDQPYRGKYQNQLEGPQEAIHE
jgi:dCTP deaminase